MASHRKSTATIPGAGRTLPHSKRPPIAKVKWRLVAAPDAPLRGALIWTA